MTKICCQERDSLYIQYMLERGNLFREDDTSDHYRLVRVLVIAVLIGQQLDHDEGDGGGNGSVEDDGDFRDADANEIMRRKKTFTSILFSDGNGTTASEEKVYDYL